jgi:hypothetical protein
MERFDFYINQLLDKQAGLEAEALAYAQAHPGERLAARAKLLEGSLIYAAAHLAYHAAVVADAATGGAALVGGDLARAHSAASPVFQCGRCRMGSDDGIGWAFQHEAMAGGAGPLCPSCARDAERCAHVDEASGLRCALRVHHEPPCLPPDGDAPAPRAA